MGSKAGSTAARSWLDEDVKSALSRPKFLLGTTAGAGEVITSVVSAPAPSICDAGAATISRQWRFTTTVYSPDSHTHLYTRNLDRSCEPRRRNCTALIGDGGVDTSRAAIGFEPARLSRKP